MHPSERTPAGHARKMEWGYEPFIHAPSQIDDEHVRHAQETLFCSHLVRAFANKILSSALVFEGPYVVCGGVKSYYANPAYQQHGRMICDPTALASKSDPRGSHGSDCVRTPSFNMPPCSCSLSHFQLLKGLILTRTK